MATSQLLGTMFFSLYDGSREFGWSESIWLPSATDLPGALSKLDALAKKRSQLLGSGCLIQYLRVSQQNVDGAGGVFRDSQIEEPNYKTTEINVTDKLDFTGMVTKNTIYNPDLQADATAVATPDAVRVDQPQAGILLRVEGTSTNFTVRRSMILRGLPDYLVNTYVDNPEQVTKASNWNKAYQAWKKLLISPDYGVLSLDRSAANPVGQIQGINTVAAQPVLTIAGLPQATKVGDKVRISGNSMLDPSEIGFNLNGLWVVQTISGTNYTFLNMTAPIGSTSLKWGVATRQSHLIVAVSAVIQRRWANRETGVPFDQPHGKRRKKKK